MPPGPFSFGLKIDSYVTFSHSGHLIGDRVANGVALRSTACFVYLRS